MGRTWDKRMKSLLVYLKAMRDSEGVESRQVEEAVKVTKALHHALRVGDVKRARALVGELAEVFIHGGGCE